MKAKKELDRPRVGRTVRREGKVEAIADERAALADAPSHRARLERD